MTQVDLALKSDAYE